MNRLLKIIVKKKIIKNPKEEYINYIKGIIKNTLTNEELNTIKTNIDKIISSHENINKNKLKIMLNPTIFQKILTKFVEKNLKEKSKNINSEKIENYIYNKIRKIDKSKKLTNKNRNIAENRIKILLNPETQRKFIEEYNNEKIILNKNFKLNLIDENGNTPLMIAIKNNNTKMAKLLIEKGCNLDIQNKDGNTALMIAIINNHIDIAKLLIEKGCNLDIQNKDGNTALMIAIKKNQIDIAILLINNKCNLNLQNKDGMTALMFTIVAYDIYLNKKKNVNPLQRIFSFLITSKRSNLNLRDKKGRTAAILLRQKNCPKLDDIFRWYKKEEYYKNFRVKAVQSSEPGKVVYQIE